MKKLIPFLVLSTMIATGCGFMGNSQNKSISVRKNDAGYKFTAEFPRRKTETVIKYINTTFQGKRMFVNPYEPIDTQVNIGDSVRFHLITEPGYVKVDFKKMENTEVSYKKLERMCAGIKDVLN